MPFKKFDLKGIDTRFTGVGAISKPSVQPRTPMSPAAAFTLPAPIGLGQAFSSPPAAPPDFVLPGLVAGTVGLLIAPGGTGKSYWALEAAVTVAGGPDLLSLGPLQTGPVLLLAAEDPPPILQSRLHTLGQMLPPSSQNQVAERLSVLPVLGTGIDLHGRDAEHWAALITERAQGHRLVVFDTLSRMHSGDENDRKDVARVMRRLEHVAVASGAAVLALHHTGKQTDASNPQAARGSSAWTDDARWVGYLLAGQDLRFGVSKANYLPRSDATLLRRDASGFLLAEAAPPVARSQPPRRPPAVASPRTPPAWVTEGRQPELSQEANSVPSWF